MAPSFSELDLVQEGEGVPEGGLVLAAGTASR